MAPHAESDFITSTAKTPSEIDIPVLIVGGGPTGLLQAHLLSQLGVKSLIIERYPKRLDAPKAHALSPRTLEICRQFAIDVNDIRKLGTQREDAYWVNFVISLSGHHVGSLPYERMDAEVLADTPTMIHNIPQPVFEQVVADHLREGREVDVRKNHSFVSCEQHDDIVKTTVEDRDVGLKYQIRSRMVIACDGAKSKVRDCLGIECEGESSYETMMTIHFNADLRSVVGENVGMLHWVMDPEVSGFIIGYDLDNNQVLICNFDSTKHPVESWDEELCRKTVTAAIGSPLPFDILSHRPWVLSRKVAESYRVGSVFLAGDAAHSFPPTGGLGLNSGLGDVHNLAYKIAAVIQGWGGSELLDTYQSDRRQVALVNSQQSVKNGKQIFGLLKTLGITDGDLQKAKENLYRRIRGPSTRHGVMKGVEEQREHFDNLGLHIGYIYGDSEIPPSASLYVHSYRPGARLPHAWISSATLPPCARRLPAINSSYVAEFSEQELRSKEYSTLDLCAFDAFTLIANTSSSCYWQSTLDEVRSRMGKTTQRGLKVSLVLLGQDFELVPGARAREWVKGFQLRQGAAVMIRPDQHILNTFHDQTTSDEVFEDLKQQLRF